MKHPSLAELLQVYECEEFREPVAHICSGHMATWPRAVRESLLLAETVWRRDAGRIEDRGVLTTCIETEGTIWCVVRIYFLHVRDEETVSQPSSSAPLKAESASASGSGLADAAARVPFTPSMCAAGIGGWGKW